MSEYGSVNLKKRYLGDVFPGQELNYCRIEVALNAVSVIVMKNGYARVVRFVDDEAGVSLLKSKLRVYLQTKRSQGRWRWIRVNSTTTYIMIYYPSVSWGARRGKTRLFCQDEAF